MLMGAETTTTTAESFQMPSIQTESSRRSSKKYIQNLHLGPEHLDIHGWLATDGTALFVEFWMEFLLQDFELYFFEVALP